MCRRCHAPELITPGDDVFHSRFFLDNYDARVTPTVALLERSRVEVCLPVDRRPVSDSAGRV